MSNQNTGKYIVLHKCNQPGCSYETKRKSHLKSHKANIHDIGVLWHKCEHCDHKTKQKSDLTQHNADIHDIGVIWYRCQHCDYKAKQKGTLNRHKANIHDIGVLWHKCEHCDHKTKDKSHLNRHKADIHDIRVTWYSCSQCDYKAKQKGTLNSRIEIVHDIGKNECQFCYKNRNSTNKYLCEKTGTTSSICNKCYNSVTGKHTRKEKDWSDYLDKHLGVIGLLSSDKSLKSVGGCQMYRPDKLYTCINYVEIGECDEFEHKYSNGSYDCDERRISEIYEEEGIIGKDMCVLRWNPDNYTPKEGMNKLSRKDRLKTYVKLAKHLREKSEHDNKIHIYYLFYSEDNPRLSKNFPYTIIHCLDDIDDV